MLTQTSANNKRIVKNTLLLYLRMIVMMFIGLYTSRVILNALGVSDLGLQNVAGGVVSMFTFLNGTLASGTQRFISYDLGSGDTIQLKKTFQTAMTLHLILALVIVLLSETVGLWYMYNKLNVEPGRMEAALWCFHLSVISSVVSIIQVPFMSCLIAHEKMGAFAYMTIYDATCKLLAAYLIMMVSFDRLIFYSSLCLVFSLIGTYIYNFYCRRHFDECSFTFGYDKAVFRKMLSFSSWNTLGCMAVVGQTTGVNLVINLFCGTAINGARAIAFQANGLIMRFVDNFQVAMNPQIIKYYSSNDIDNMSRLVIRGALIASFLLLFLGIPLFIEIEWVINLWLGKCPDYVPIFLRIVLIESLFRTMGNPTITAMHATGQMKEVNYTVGLILLCILPVSYLLFKLGFSVEFVLAANVIPWVIVPFVRIHWLNKYADNRFPTQKYLKQVYCKMPLLAILMFSVPYFIKCQMTDDNFLTFVIVGFASVITSSSVIYFWGMDSEMRLATNNMIKKIISKI